MKGYAEAQKIDATKNVNDNDRDSVSRNFPGWNNVRSSYNRCRQQATGDYEDPYDLPEKLKITYMGSIRIGMNKIVTDEHMFEFF